MSIQRIVGYSYALQSAAMRSKPSHYILRGRWSSLLIILLLFFTTIPSTMGRRENRNGVIVGIDEQQDYSENSDPGIAATILFPKNSFIRSLREATTGSAEVNDSVTHSNNTEQEEEVHEEEEHEEHIHAAVYCLFPSFVLTIGVVCFYILSRYMAFFPYTGVLFMVGAIMGIGAALSNGSDHLDQTIRLWIPINSEVLLLIFLPGLIFKDSMGQNSHLFIVALMQCILFAFPLVLAGTVLTALVAYYILPYGWSFNLAMVFGAILSATDPVAVAFLMEQVGAPPRLKVHINGEALLNDGSSIVFFSIFIKRYLYELEIPGIGEDVDVRTGVGLFCRKAFGGVAAGAFFGFGLLYISSKYNNRFSKEEVVVEVSATVAIAYVGYYVADTVWQTSGVIANVTSGVITTFFGRQIFLDVKLLDEFWSLVEHLLNTVLFTLGGVVWGGDLVTGYKDNTFGAKDWGYLIVLYIMLTIIRAFLFFVLYPVTVRIGLKTNVKETLFQIHGGLRGAVGIALAIYLNSTVTEAQDGVHNEDTTKAFALVGGVAFLTLTINGTTAGPLLHYLALTASSDTREKIVDAYQTRFRSSAIDEMVRLLAERRFRSVQFSIVKQYVPYLAEMTKEQLMEAVTKHRETTANLDYTPPYLGKVLPYLKSANNDRVLHGKESALTDDDEGNINDAALILDQDEYERKLEREERIKNRKRLRRMATSVLYMMHDVDLSLVEHRSLFISILRAAYEKQISEGELDSTQVLAIGFVQSLEMAAALVANGEPLKDWECFDVVQGPLISVTKFLNTDPLSKFRKTKKKSMKAHITRLRIERALSFITAHKFAQDYFRREFQHQDKQLSEACKLVILESEEELKKAEIVLKEVGEECLACIVSIKFCSILLNRGVKYLSELREHGLLSDSETEHLVEEMKGWLDIVDSSDSHSHQVRVSKRE